MNRRRVIAAALLLADERGIDSLTMRNLADEFGVVPMALYKHVASKDELLGLMVDDVFSEIELDPDMSWRPALRGRAISMREALLKHPWAIGLMESGTFGPARLRDHEIVMRCLREQVELSFAMALHAFSLVDSLVYGFTLQQKALSVDPAADEATKNGEPQRDLPSEPDEYPYATELIREVGRTGYDFSEEFKFGLELVLDDIERLRQRDGAYATREHTA